jgi:hypothetical protein
MNKLFLVFLALALASCGDSGVKIAKVKDSTRHIDSIMAAADRPDDEQETPSLVEERERISKSYDNIQLIDTLLMSGKDTLRLHLKYYCLKSGTLVIPKKYEVDEKKPENFITHEFATDILLIANSDTILNKQFKATDFNSFFEDPFAGNLKKYGSVIDLPGLSTKDIGKGIITLHYSIAIPTTDLGIGLTLAIRKDGTYKAFAN